MKNLFSLFCVLAISLGSIFGQSVGKIDSLLLELEMDKKGKVSTLKQIAYEHLRLKDSFAVAWKYLKEAEEEINHRNDSLSMAAFYTELGDMHWKYNVRKEKRKAVNEYLRAHEIYDKFDLHPEMAYCMRRIGKVHAFYFDNEQAVIPFMEAITSYEEIDDQYSVAETFLELSESHFQISDWDNSLTYASNAMDHAGTLEEAWPLKQRILNQIAITLAETKNWKDAIAYVKEGMALPGDKDGGQVCMANYVLGLSFLNLIQLDSAYQSFLKTQKQAYSLGSAEFLVRAWVGEAMVFNGRRDYSKAKVVLDQAIDLVEKNELPPKLKLDIYDAYFLTYSGLGNSVAAGRYHNRYKHLSDSLNNARYAYQMELQALSYEDKIRKKELEGLNSKNALLEKDKLLSMTVATIIGLVAVFFLILFIQKQRNNLTLSALVEERTEELEVTNEELQKVNKELDTFAYRTTHDVRGPVARLLGLCQIAIEDQENTAEFPHYLKMIYGEALSMDDMLHRFLEVNKIKYMKVQPTEIDLFELLESCVKVHEHLENFGNVQMNLSISGELRLNTDKNLLQIILTNIIENAILYSRNLPNGRSFFEVSAYEFDGNAVIRIKDNGIGIPKEIQEKVFEMFFRGTTHSKGLGLGLYSAKLAIEKINGSIHLNETKELATEVEIFVPKLEKAWVPSQVPSEMIENIV